MGDLIVSNWVSWVEILWLAFRYASPIPHVFMPIPIPSIPFPPVLTPCSFSPSLIPLTSLRPLKS